MKTKFTFFAILLICALLFSGCDEFIEWLLEGDEGSEETCKHILVWVVTTPATSTTDGLKAERCSRCGYLSGKAERIPAFGTGNNTESVGPLMQTKWNQRVPYNIMSFYPDRPIGCWPVAAAQLMKYHEHPVRVNGQSAPFYSNRFETEVPSVSFNINYDWNNMLNTYSSSATEPQRNAVAALMWHIAVSMEADFGTVSSERTVVNTFMTFGYDRSLQWPMFMYYDNATIEKMVREQLDAGRPVVLSGNGHAQIVDGYNDTGKFHINYGWGGKHDGWYSLNAIYQSGEEEFDDERTGLKFMINIKPDEGGVSAGYEIGLRNFAASKTSVPQNELFTVTAQMRNESVLDTFPGGQAGVALADNSGNIAAVIGSITFNSLNTRTTRTSTINCFVPETVNPRQYNLRVVTRPENEDWRLVTLSAIRQDIPNSIPVTVTAGLANGGGYKQVLREFSASQYSASRGEQFTVTFSTRNISSEQYPGGLQGAALVDNNGNIVVIGSRNVGTLNSGSSRAATTINCTVPNTVPSGLYRLQIVIGVTGSDELRIATLSLDDIQNSYVFEVM